MKQGWEIKKLSEIGKVFNGNSINEKVKKDKYTGLDDGLPFIATKDVGFDSEIDYENGVRIPFNEINQFKIAPSKTPLICAEGGSAGRKIGFTNQDVCFGNKLFALVSNKNVDSKYVYYYYFTSSFQKHFSTEMAGIIGGVSMNKFKDIEIPLPPLPEQQRIVSILDEAFAAIAKAKANAEQNLKNAKELFESYLQGVFENGDWGYVKLSEMATDISDGDHMPPPKSEFGLPFITISNINKQTHKIDFSDTFKVPQEYYNDLKPNKKPINGDVLYTVTGSYGIPVLIEDNFQFCFQRHIGLIRPSKKLDSKLLYYWILSPQAISQANETAIGAAQKTVSLKSLRNFSFPNIPLNEQQTIVRQLDALRAETQKLESVYQKKIDDLEELKKSILQKAFAGELMSEPLINAD